MQLLTFQQDHLGVKLPGGILDVSESFTLDALLTGGDSAKAALEQYVLDHADGPLLDENQITYGPCVPHPGKIICLGMNYQRHTAKLEPGQQPSPILFAKYMNSLASAGEAIPLPPVAVEYD